MIERLAFSAERKVLIAVCLASSHLLRDPAMPEEATWELRHLVAHRQF
jgi:hypothetical protein